MKFVLKDFQIAAVDLLVKRLHDAASATKQDTLQSVCLASPTGSGKTIIVTAAIERMLRGDDAHAPDPDAVFLWITDQPELNEQTRRKMLAASNVLDSSKLIVIDASFDRPTLVPGCVHFLNTQKLGKEKSLVTQGDGRAHTIWETVTNTVTLCAHRFFVIIDEAHRGMNENGSARKEATTIIQKFIKSSPGEIPPVPLVVGVSATPERFTKLIGGTNRVTHPVEIKPEDVRASGLLKEVIALYHPRTDQPSDMTMLGAAVRSWQRYTTAWAGYCATQGKTNPPVVPILVVQVQDGTATQVSKTPLEDAIAAIRAVAGELPAVAFAHAFQEGAEVKVGDIKLRYLAPSDIQDDPDVRVVFFKTSLSTGWDCPRAEVMMSFRTAVDVTSIAQLIGRMVRTPLARRVDDDEFLNTVALYLPHYDEKALAGVIEYLATPDAANMAPLRVERGETVTILGRAPGTEAIFTALEQLPSYTIPRSRKSSEIRRLMKLARLLSRDGIDEDAPEKATAKLLASLRTVYDQIKVTEPFQALVNAQGRVEVRAVHWRVGTDAAAIEEGKSDVLDLADKNLAELVEAAGRKLGGEGLPKAWRLAREREDPSARTKAQRELVALCLDHTVLKDIEATARQTTQKWLKAHNAKIAALPDGDRQAYAEVYRLATQSELVPLVYPTTIEGTTTGRAWTKHLYVDEKGAYHASFNKWETAVLEVEVARDDVVAWLRNPDRKPWSLCVPYDCDGNPHPLYPDFLVVCKADAGVEINLIDPHSDNLGDAPDKAKGLAVYADHHAPKFGRIEMIVLDGDTILRLDLTDEVIREKAKAVTSHSGLRQLFKDA